MEQIQNQLRMTQTAKNKLANMRALELESKHPQLTAYDNQPEPSEPIYGSGSGGEAGLRRIVGTGRRAKKMEGGFLPLLAAAVPLISSLFGRGEMTKDAHDKLMKLTRKRKIGDQTKLHGGFWGVLASLAAPLIGKLFGKGQMTKTAHDELMKVFGKSNGTMKEMESESEDEGEGEVKGGAMRQGSMLAKHIEGKYGMPYLRSFIDGMSKSAPAVSAVVKGRGSHKMMRGCGTSMLAIHAPMSSALSGEEGAALGGQDVPPGGEAPMAYGNPPQAPASFQRNTVGMGYAGAGRAGGARAGAGKLKIIHEGGAKPKRSNARAAVVKRVMAEKGMSMIEASKYVKEHGLY